MKNNNSFSPLLRLYKFRPSKKHTPRENFVTESFAILLFYNPDITKIFLKEFLNISTLEEIIINTQVPHIKDSIFDMILTDSNNFHVVIECKMGAGVGKSINNDSDQLDKYINHLKIFPIKDKYLMLIDIGNLTLKEDLDVKYKAIRWKDVKIFLENQTGKTDVGEFLRSSFIDLLINLKVDRTLINGRLSWKCQLCGREMISPGIISHKKKHEREPHYSKLIDDENKETKNEFEKIIFPHKDNIKIILEKLKNIKKIEKANYIDSKEISILLEKYLPKNIWIYLINQISYCFSNKAYSDFREDIILKLKSENEQFVEEPNYIASSYENIIKLVDKNNPLCSKHE